MLMSAGDKDSLNVTASCPHAAHFSYLGDFSFHETAVTLGMSILPGVCNREGT